MRYFSSGTCRECGCRENEPAGARVGRWLLVGLAGSTGQKAAFGGSIVDSPAFSLIEKQEHIELAARALKAIAHPLRLKILCVVGDQEACVQEIVDAVGTSQSNISQHLAILREKGVLLTRKDANRVYYRVGDARTLQLIGMMREVFCGVSSNH